MALALTACEKEKEFNQHVSTPETTKILQQSNHTHTTKCASKAHMRERLQDPTYRINHKRNKARFENSLKTTAKSRSACASPIILPVAIHYQGVSSSDRACLVAVAQAAIVATNKDFLGQNVEISTQWRNLAAQYYPCLLYTSPSPRDATLSRMPSSA